ncbi:MAG TPA: response regulator [Ferrovibrio sp.]|uniref:response regulator n=1 Tax=Ferrovibrio sp. TaxID=1917215 RepID=UPI002ED1311D
MSNFWKLTPTIALTIAVALLLAGMAMALYSEHAYKAQKIDEVGVQAQILASTVTAALAFDDRNAAQEYVNALKANPEIRAAAIYDENGALFASYTRAEDLSLPVTPQPRPPYFEDDRLIVATPVRQGDSLLGTVYLRTLIEPIGRRLVRYGVVALLVTMASLVVAVLGVAHRALTRANAELGSRASDLAEANRKLRIQIEQRQEAEEALRQSQKMEAIGQLSGGIAHDFNNLLTIIGGNLELLRKRIKEGRTDVMRYVDLAAEGVNRASNLTQRILAFSRRQPLSPKPVDLSRLVVGMEQLLRHSVGELVTVETRLEADWWTLCDVNQMENVILNLAINARDAMPAGGRLIIETANLPAEAGADAFAEIAPGDYVRLSVIDTGTGMPEEVRLKAIDPFFTTKPQGQGTGLGLSMIFGYTKQSNGFMQIESALGEGTTVTILMPRHQGARHQGNGVADAAAARREAGPAPQADAPPATDAKRPTVLLVEDEALVRMLAVETIRDEGYNVLEEGDGRAALTILKSDAEIDLLITDVKLPGVSGYQLAEAGTAHRPRLKVVLMTGFTQDPVPEKLARAGVKVLYKPYDLKELASYANRLLREDDPA